MSFIDLAIDTLQQYKICNKTKELVEKHPYEMKRRETYLNNVIRQLARCRTKASQEILHLLADDIRHCMLHGYYPDLPRESCNDGFNFKNTLEDVVQLIDSEDSIIFSA